MAELKLDISDRTISVVSPANGLVQSNVEVDTMTAVFDDDWAEVATTYVVFTNGSTSLMSVYEDGMAVPWEALEDAGRLYVTFVGYFDDETPRIVTRIMSNPVVVGQSGKFTGDEPAEASADVLQQLTAAAASANEAAASANEAAGTASSSSAIADEAAAAANEAAAAALGSVSADATLYLTTEAVGEIEYLTLVDTED